MRSEDEVQDRIRYLLTQEVSKRVQEACARLPHKCKNNARHPLDVRKRVAGEPNEQYNVISGKHLPVIGLCMLGSEDPTSWPGNICEDPIDAQRCPFFDPIDTKETVQAEFHQQIRDLAWVQANLPEVAGLLWALGSEALPKLPWWKALWFRLVQIRPDSLVRARTLELPSGD
jgi:hypothetical protein